MSLAAIVRALGGDLRAGGRRANIPGPGHSPADRSVSLLLAGDRVIVHSFAGDDWRAVLRDLQDRGLVNAEGRLAGGAGAPSGRSVEELSPARGTRIAVARDLWREGRPVAGTLAEAHCRRRGVGVGLPGALRHHPGIASAVYRNAGVRRPALLAAIRGPAGDLCAVELTYLAANGERARVTTPRKTVGVCPAGCAVRLAPAARRMLVGVFTTLSAAEVFRLPAWALLSTRNLVRWRPPPGVEAVLIAGDRGAPGERAAASLAAALGRDGVKVEIGLAPRRFR